MDVWFDSGSSWSLIEKEVGGREGKAIADVCLEGSDQHRGWFQSLLLTCVGMEEKGGTKMPYETVITHGFVLDQEGKKMSKSVGNVISPMSVVDGGKVCPSCFYSTPVSHSSGTCRISNKCPRMVLIYYACGQRRSIMDVIPYWGLLFSNKPQRPSGRFGIRRGLFWGIWREVGKRVSGRRVGRI